MTFSCHDVRVLSHDAVARHVDAHFRGDFDTHVTVECVDEAQLAALEAWAGHEGLRFTHVLLDRGTFASQPMVTLRGRGTLSQVAWAAERAVAALTRARFRTTRIKIEAAPWNEGVPATDGQARLLGAGRYFEHHVKVLLHSAADVSALTNLVQPHRARLSRNARRIRSDGREERFVTQRCRLVGLPAAKRHLDTLTDDLRGHRYALASVEQEFVVYDSDESVDAGWLEDRAPTTTGRVDEGAAR